MISPHSIIIEEVIRNNNISMFGFCDFNKVANELIECRAKKRLPKNPESIISFAFPYKVPSSQHNISRYAIVPDYHTVIMALLNGIVEQLSNKLSTKTFVPFVDNSPIPEVKVAALSGLGVIGKNTLLITPNYGSWVFLAEIVTDLKIACVENKINTCIQCERCEVACITKSISNFKISRNLCVSNISQKKGSLSAFEEGAILKSGLIWGCDRCQEICPMNKNKLFTDIKPFLEGGIPIIKHNDYDSMTDRAFLWRPKKVIERNLQLLSLYKREQKK